MEEIKLLKRKRKAQLENNKTVLLSVCTDLADFYIKRGEYLLAIEEYKILASIHESDNKIEYAKTNRGIGEAYMGLHNFKTALEYFKIYLGISIEQKDELEKQRAFATLGHANLAWYLETQNEPETTLNVAFKYFTKSLVIAECLTGISKLEKVDMTSRLFSNMGLVKECLGDYDEALDLLNKSITICKQNDIYEQLSRGYLSIASLYEKKCDSNEAIKHYNLAIDAAKKLKGSVDLICTALQAKSDALIKLVDFHGAKQALVKAYKLKTPNLRDRKAIEHNLRIVAKMCYTEDKLVVSSGDNKEMKNLYENMGDCACELKHFSSAIKYYHLMLQYAEKCGISNRELASCYYSLAETYKDNGQFDKAVEYFEKEYDLCKTLQDNLNTLSKIADTKESANDSKEEIKNVYDKAIKNCQDNKNLKEEIRMVNRCIAYLRRNNHHNDAFEMENYRNSLGEINPEDWSSSSDCESEQSEIKGGIGSELNLDDITDNSGDSDIENQATENMVETISSKRRSRNFAVKKNQKGETQLHTACITGKLPVVKHLLDQGHPVNIRDHTGWLPLHEACNHGFYEIVKLLLDKGASINDRGGTLCNGVTPLYDAASNGHLKIVELLLDRGASAIIKTDEGDTPLHILKEWSQKNSLTGEQSLLCQSLICRMTEIMQRTGQKILASSHERNSFTKAPAQEVNKVNKISPKNDRFGFLNADNYDDIMNADSTSEEFLENEDVEQYQTVMNKFKRKSSMEENSRNSNKKSTPALVSSEEALLDDWLEDDLFLTTKAVKKRKVDPINSALSSAGPSSSTNTLVSPRSRSFISPQKTSQKKTSNDFIIPSHFFDDDLESIIVEPPVHPINNETRRDSVDSNSSRNSNSRKSQMSLLETGFSRRNSDTLKSQTTSSKSPLKRNNSAEISKSIQPKLTNFLCNRSFTEPDSTTQIRQMDAEPLTSLTPVASVGELMVYVDIKIDGMLFRIPILLSQVQTNTLGWLAEQAALKYARKEGTKPQLDLETTNGALLSEDDPVSVLFPLGAVQAEPVIGKIIKMSLPPLAERYKETCLQMDTDLDENLCALLEVMSIDLNLRSKWFHSKSILPLCKALNHQTSLFELNLSENCLDMNCVKNLCVTLPTLINLVTLNLKNTGLSVEHLAELVTVFTSTTHPVLQKLQNLDLSDNFLRDRSFLHVSIITQHLKLSSLNLSNVKFTENLFVESKNENSALNLNNIQLFDISDNRLSGVDILKILRWIEFSKLRKLNISRNFRRVEGLLQGITEILEDIKVWPLESLNLSRCMVQENELYEFLRLAANSSLTDLNLSHNPDITGISLRRLLEFSKLQTINLIGCDKILHYFGDCDENDYLLQDNDHKQKKMLKISVHHEENNHQLDTLIKMFNKKYVNCDIEKKERMGITLLYISSKPLDRIE